MDLNLFCVLIDVPDNIDLADCDKSKVRINIKIKSKVWKNRIWKKIRNKVRKDENKKNKVSKQV